MRVAGDTRYNCNHTATLNWTGAPLPPYRCAKPNSVLGPGDFIGLDLYDGEQLDRTQVYILAGAQTIP